MRSSAACVLLTDWLATMRRPAASGVSTHGGGGGGGPHSDWGDVPPPAVMSEVGDGSKQRRRHRHRRQLQGGLLQHMPMLTIAGVPLVPERAELRRLLCTPSCVGSVLFTFAVSVCIVLAPAWRETLRLQRIEQEQRAKVYGSTGVEHTDARATPLPPHSPSTPEGPVDAEVAGSVLTAVLYHDVLHRRSHEEKQEPFSV